ncbi:hypothetical protein D1872_204210 [compost metagenome]
MVEKRQGRIMSYKFKVLRLWSVYITMQIVGLGLIVLLKAFVMDISDGDIKKWGEFFLALYQMIYVLQLVVCFFLAIMNHIEMKKEACP